MVLRINFISIFLFLALNAFSQVSNGEELYLRDPEPRFHGKEVEQLQKFLLYSGFDIGKDGVDGWFGRDTDKALREYQKDNNIPVTGRIVYGSFPVDLEWKTEIKVWKRENDPDDSKKQKMIPEDLNEIKTYYGSYTLIRLNEYGESFFDFLLSPSGRFIVYSYYFPDMDTIAGMPVFVYDLLTAKSKVVYPFDTFPGMEYSEDLKGGNFKNFYWTDNDELFLDAVIYYSDGSDKTNKAVFYSLDSNNN